MDLGKLVDPFGIGKKIFGGSKSPKVPDAVSIFAKGRDGEPSLASSQAKGLLDYYGQYVPGFVGLTKTLGPDIQAAELGSMQSFLTGTGDQAGILGLQKYLGSELAKTLAKQRKGELKTMGKQAGLARGVMEALSPEQASAVERAQAEADRAYTASLGVSPEERRSYEQQSREAFQSAGRLGGNLGVVSEAMGREDVLARKRAEAARARESAYSLAGQFYTTPGLNLVSKTPLSYSSAMPLLSTAIAGGPATSGAFDYNMPINLAMTQANAQNAQNLAQFQADMQAKAAKQQMLGQVLSLAAAPFTGGASLMAMPALSGGGGGFGGFGGFGA